MSLCLTRLDAERKSWRKDHPVGFWAKPKKGADGKLDMMNWEAGIPGKEDTDWAGAIYPITIEFPKEYPQKPPKVRFPSGFFHPNVYPSGTICLSILNEDQGWKPSITFKQIMQGVQNLLDEPNLSSPAQQDAYDMLRKNSTGYNIKVKQQARSYSQSSN